MRGQVPALVKTAWLHDALRAASKVRVLDASFYVQSDAGNAHQEYSDSHIPGASYFDIRECCDKTNKFKYMVPNPEQFAAYIGQRGICNQTHVVVYDRNEKYGILSAARVWWMFRLFGYHQVSVLDGGLCQWQKDGYTTTASTETPEPQGFQATLDKSLLKHFEEMEENIEKQEFQVMDARGPERFNGSDPERNKGHMPNAINVPYFEMMCPNEKVFKEPAKLKEVFHSHGVDLERPLAATCGGGVSACILALGAHLCGKEDVAVYDGSWAEWSVRAKAQHVVS